LPKKISHRISSRIFQKSELAILGDRGTADFFGLQTREKFDEQLPRPVFVAAEQKSLREKRNTARV
jgi:hypothetical protein